MRFSSILAAIAAASVAATPVVAAPKPAPVSEVAPQSETVDGEQLRRGFLLPLAIIIAIIIGVILLTNDEEDPVSP